MQESGLSEVIPLVPTLAILGQYPILSHPESPQGTTLELAAVVQGLVLGSPFVSILTFLRVHHQGRL